MAAGVEGAAVAVEAPGVEALEVPWGSAAGPEGSGAAATQEATGEGRGGGPAAATARTQTSRTTSPNHVQTSPARSGSAPPARSPQEWAWGTPRQGAGGSWA